MSPDKKPPPRRAGRKANTADVKLGSNDLIAARLRKLYDGIAQQPIPDRFVELLRELESKDAGQVTAADDKAD